MRNVPTTVIIALLLLCCTTGAQPASDSYAALIEGPQSGREGELPLLPLDALMQKAGGARRQHRGDSRLRDSLVEGIRTGGCDGRRQR